MLPVLPGLERDTEARSMPVLLEVWENEARSMPVLLDVCVTMRRVLCSFFGRNREDEAQRWVPFSLFYLLF